MKRCLLASVLLCAGLACDSGLCAQDLELQLWVAWGGGAARRWQGEFRVESPSASDGAGPRITAFESCGLTPDEAGSMYLDAGRLIVLSRTPRTYDAVKLMVQAPRDARLSISLIPDGRTETARPVEVPLEQLITQFHASDVDDRGSRLLVRRSPGDELRVRFDRSSLVFAPGEQFQFFVDPHLVAVEPDTSLTCDVELRRARSEEAVWQEAREVRSDARAEPPEVGPLDLRMPDAEGAYDLRVTLSKRFLPTRFVPSKIIHERHLQVVVVGTSAPEAEAAAWQVVAEVPSQIDAVPAASGSHISQIWKSFPKLPQFKWIPGSHASDTQAPLGNGLSRRRVHANREYTELLPGGWQAYVLPVQQLGRPHLVEIGYPQGVAQTLGVSVVEPNAADMVSPIGPNFGLHVASDDPAAQQIERHRVVFWPRTEKPVLLLTNRREDVPAVYANIRVLAGPTQLPAASAGAATDSRLAALYLDQPLIADNFSASDALDKMSGRNLRDWDTFLQAGSRLTQYVRYAGFNGAMLSVLHEGSALYPSPLVQPIPKHDNGVFFDTGQDPLRKDVLELMFRLFDRQGLKLVPALQFSAPLPELEAALRPAPPLPRTASASATNELRSSSSAASRGRQPPDVPTSAAPRDGIELIAADGRSWRQIFGGDRSAGPYYNPLSPRVQQALRNVVLELADRYGKHSSFGGVAIQLSPYTYAQFPDVLWGCDPDTLSRFAKDERLQLPGLADRDREQLAAYLTVTGRDRWLAWRARKLAEFYQSLGSALRERAAGGKLYLAGADLLIDPQIQDDLQPKLPERFDLTNALLRLGVDPACYRDSSGVVLLRPYRRSPLAPFEAQAVDLQLWTSTEADALYGFVSGQADRDSTTPPFRQRTGTLLFQEPRTFSVATFKQTSPFGPENTADWQLAHVTDAGLQRRQWLIHSLATLDCQELFVGGWMAVFGQEEILADVLESYQQLPAGHFETVPCKTSQVETQPIVVRRLCHDGRTYLYAVNDTRWPVAVTFQFETPDKTTFRVLGKRSWPSLTSRGATQSWSVSLLPYDLVAASFSAPDVKVVDWRAEFGRNVPVEIGAEIEDLRKRAHKLREPQPLPVLANPGFELARQGDVLPGWEHLRSAGVSVQVVPEPTGSGGSALCVQSEGPVVWVRSNPFPTPKTGRVALWVSLKTENPNEQPPLQLAVEGRLDGDPDPYYRAAGVGALAPKGDTVEPLTTAWKPFVVVVNNLPSTGLTDLRVAIDLMGKGKVWVDDVQVFDLWFDKSECNELLKKIARANWNLGKGEVTQCERILQGYWPQFLRHDVPLNATPRPAVPVADASRQEPTPPGKPPAEQPSASTSWLKKIVPKAPKLPTWFR